MIMRLEALSGTLLHFYMCFNAIQSTFVTCQYVHCINVYNKFMDVFAYSLSLRLRVFPFYAFYCRGNFTTW